MGEIPTKVAKRDPLDPENVFSEVKTGGKPKVGLFGEMKIFSKEVVHCREKPE